MAEKILNTRIQLKYDSWGSWELVKDFFVPLKGEVCIVNPGTSTGSVTNTPCLMKVGDGKSVFSALPWVSAPAADVHAWAKKTETEFINWINEQIDHPVLSIEDTQAGPYIKDIEEKNGKIIVTRGAFPELDVTIEAEEVPVTDAVNVIKELTGNGHVLTAFPVQVPTITGVGKEINSAIEKLGALAQKNTIDVTLIDNFDSEVAGVKVNQAKSADKVGHKLTAGTKQYDGSADITITAADLGLTKIMNFLGTTSTSLAEGSTTNPVTISGSSVTAQKGDVVLSGNKEFVFDGTNWKELGDQGSHALKSVTITGTGYLSGGGSLEANRTIDISDATKTKIDNGATAYGWGNHASQGYAKSADLGDLAVKDKITATDISGTIGKDKITNFNTEVAAIKVSKAGDADTLGGHDPSYFATADSALQSVKVLGATLTKTSNELTVATAKSALGLKSAAYTESSAYATSA